MKTHQLTLLKFLLLVPFLIIALEGKGQKSTSGSQPDSAIVNSAITLKNLSVPDSNLRYKVGEIVEITIPATDKLSNWRAVDLLLYINGLPMNGLHPEGPPVLWKDGSKKLVFVLARKRSNQDAFEAWNRFYKLPAKKEFPVEFSVGTATQELSSRSKDTKLELVKQDKLPYIWLTAAVVTGLVVYLAWKSNLLQEGSPEQGYLYSLSRTQIAWWTIIVVACFIHLYYYTNELTDISSSTLILLGVSAATLVGAKVADETKPENSVSKQTKFNSRGFITDILTDGVNGVSIHRFQFVLWTLALTVVFFTEVFNNYAMPDFPPNLLLLMGISNGTYMLLKLPENSSPDPGPAEAPQDADERAEEPKAPAEAAAPEGASSRSSVTPEGDVISREEEDMSMDPTSDQVTGANTPNPNHALG